MSDMKETIPFEEHTITLLESQRGMLVAMIAAIDKHIRHIRRVIKIRGEQNVDT